MVDNDELWTVPQAAAFLQVPISRIYFLTHTKQIGVVRLGHRTIRIRKSDLMAWISHRTERGEIGDDLATIPRMGDKKVGP